MVRVTNRKTAERHLLKDFVGRVIDLAFAHSDDVLLSVVDEIGNLLIYELKPTAYGKISYPLLCIIQLIDELTMNLETLNSLLNEMLIL